MFKRIILWLGCVALMTFALYAGETLLQQRRLAEKTIRLHVVANSDTEADQAQKLRVRDAVLAQVSVLTADCAGADEARAVLAANLPALERAAQQVLTAEGSDYGVQVSLGTESFDTRRYDTFTLPAGDYPSLRVRIGAARGQNWWCVVFPALCAAATGDGLEGCARAGGYEGDEVELITGGEEEYVFRFKTLEWLKALGELFH
ncbi:MAG: stage II sporulation protein R [Oscillospiraceae bacterium]|nr:stage II sporulation protein R [Oscillospiraceae bacterium]